MQPMTEHIWDDEPPFEIINPEGQSPVVILCEHASHRIPAGYDDLGLKSSDRFSHASWDPGALDLAKRLSHLLDAPLVASTVSRLVYDCNRPPDSPGAMPAISEVVKVPGNVGLSDAERNERVRNIYEPFCSAVSQVLDARGSDCVVVTVHSFTPIYFGEQRIVELGLLHDDDVRLTEMMMKHADILPHRKVKRNAPYDASDGVTHSLKIHAQSRGLANVMLEVRNDLLKDEQSIATIANDILKLLAPAITSLASKETTDEDTVKL